MRLIRNRLSWLVAGWIAIQLSALVAAPAVLYASAANVDRECDCPGALPGQQCPMHKHGGGHHESPRCAMRSTLGQSDAQLLTVVVSGVLPQARFHHDVPFIGEATAVGSSDSSSRSELPESPPPRR